MLPVQGQTLPPHEADAGGQGCPREDDTAEQDIGERAARIAGELGTRQVTTACWVLQNA